MPPRSGRQAAGASPWAARPAAPAGPCPGAAAARRCARSPGARRGLGLRRWHAAAPCNPRALRAARSSAGGRGGGPGRPATRSRGRWWRGARPSASAARCRPARRRARRRCPRHGRRPAPNPRGGAASAARRSRRARAAGRQRSSVSAPRRRERVRSVSGRASEVFVRAKGQLILDDIRGFRQTEFALCRNSQASPAAAPRFAIRCGSARAYAHKCGANLPSIERRSGPLLPTTVRAEPMQVFDPRQIQVPSGHFIGGRLGAAPLGRADRSRRAAARAARSRHRQDLGRQGRGHLRFKSVLIDFAAAH